MRLEHRLRRLERAHGASGPCRVCGGNVPAPAFLVWRRSDGESRPQRPSCPSCGAGPRASTMVILGGDGRGDEGCKHYGPGTDIDAL